MEFLRKMYRCYRLSKSYCKSLFLKILRTFFESMGVGIFSKPARYNLDDKLSKYLPERGFFIEVGGADGYTESNTYYLEKIKGWKGVLVEPIPSLYSKCLKERGAHSRVFNCALVSSDYSENSIIMKQGSLMSTVKGVLMDSELDHLKKAYYFHGVKSVDIQVPVRTLTSILDEVEVSSIDFFSLDVEGYELDVLKGFDLEKYKPNFILVECLTDAHKNDFEAYVKDTYDCIDQLTKRDFLFKRKGASLT